MAERQRVIVTGSTGNLGAKAMRALATVPGLEVLGIDRQGPDGAQGFIRADLDRFDAGWTRAFLGAACVLHLAADSSPAATWESIVRLNVDLSLNVLRAAEEGGVGRVVFASSNWVFGGYRFTRDRLGSALPPRPVNPYGASKLFVERCGNVMAQRSSTAFLALRIGYCQPGDNRPGPHMAFGRWGQEMWLGNRDWEQAVARSVTAPFTGSAAINVVSGNPGMRWDLEEARAVIGFDPAESHEPRRTLPNRLKDRGAKYRDRWFPHAGAPLFGARW